MCSPTFHRARAPACLFVCFAFVFLFFFAPPTPPTIPTPLHSYPPPFPLGLSVGLGGSSALLFYSLAAAGQLINQIFKQCFSAQWEVLDYLWLLAVPGAATHYQPFLRLPSSSLGTHTHTHSLIHSLTVCWSLRRLSEVIFSHSPLHPLFYPPSPLPPTLSLNCCWSHFVV